MIVDTDNLLTVDNAILRFDPASEMLLDFTLPPLPWLERELADLVLPKMFVVRERDARVFRLAGRAGVGGGAVMGGDAPTFTVYPFGELAGQSRRLTLNPLAELLVTSLLPGEFEQSHRLYSAKCGPFSAMNIFGCSLLPMFIQGVYRVSIISTHVSG